MIRGFTRVPAAVRELYSMEATVRRRIRQVWHNPSRYTRPVFLVGCGRSGTTMLVKQLGKSWRVDAYNENHPAAFERWRLRDLEDIARLIDQSYAETVLFKPILDTCQSRKLLTRFPDSKLLFVFRHYDDVINSSIKKFGAMNRLNHVRLWVQEDFSEFASLSPPEETKEFIRAMWNDSLNPDSGAALYWLFYNRLYYDLELNRHDRVKLVRYESVVLNPEKELRSLHQFLRLRYEPKVAAGIFSSSIKRDSPPYVEPAIRSACEDLWQRLCQ